MLQNIQPLVAVGALGVVCLRGAFLRLTKAEGFSKVEWATVVCLAYWVANYFWSTGSLENFLSIDFIRHDGAMLVPYTAFLGLLGWALKPTTCRALWAFFLSALSVIAVIGAAVALHLPLTTPLARLGFVNYEDTLLGGTEMFTGWYEAHNTAGGVYALACVLALALLQEPNLARAAKVFRWSVFVGCLGGLAISYSRGGYLGFVAGAVVVFPVKKLGQAFRAALLVVVPAALVILMTSKVLDRIDTITDPYYGTNASRLQVWGEALDDFALSPTIGIGFGRFNDGFEHYKGVRHFAWVATSGVIINDDSHAHNSYLHFMAEGGIIGLVLTMYVWWCAWAELSAFQLKLRDSKLQWLVKGAKGCIVAACVQALTEHVLGRGSILLILGTLIGTALATARSEWRVIERAHPRLPEPARAPLPSRQPVAARF